MGCGQSKINLYPRRSKNSEKRNGAKKSGSIGNEEAEEEDSTGEPAPEEPEEPDNRQHVLPISDHQPAFEVSASQQNFFKMLDEKIEQGKDYDSTSETEIECEQERRRMLIEQWRSLSQSTQSSRQGSPPTPAHRRLTRSVSKVSERQCAPGACKQPRRHGSPSRRSHSAQAHDSRHDWEPAKSPVKRTQSAGANWKSTKVAPFPKSKTSEEPVAGCSKDAQITTTYNPTFQNHSPAHKAQPYKAQIVSYPLSQQVAPPSPAKFIAPPEEYQDPEAVAQVTSQSQIYYIHGSNATPDLAQQRQQTAFHLQQYVAMKQAQQQMFTSYMQRPHTCPEAPRMLEGEELAAQYGHPGLRAPRFAQEVAHLGAPLWSPLTPVAGSWQVPPEMQYYPQSQFVPLLRAGSARGRGDKVQSLSVVRGKPAGQVVSLGGQELAVAADSPSPAASSDSGVSPGTGPSSKSSGSTPPAAPEPEPKPKKKNKALKVSKSLES